MSVSKTAEYLPLTGADCFLRAFDYESRRYNQASHLAQLVIQLGPSFNLGAFRDAVARALRQHPALHASVRRRFLLGPPVFVVAQNGRVATPCIVVTDLPGGRLRQESIPEVFFDRLNDVYAIHRGDLLRFDIVRYAESGESDLAITWAHMLFDATGSERFVAYLAGLVDAPGNGAGPATVGTGAPWSMRQVAEQSQVARRWGQHMVSLGELPTRSLAGPLRAVRQRVRYTVTALSPADTDQAVARSARYAGTLTPVTFYLAAAVRAHAAVFAGRGAEPETYLVPLPVRLPMANETGLAIGTNVSLLWFRVLRERTRDFGLLVEELRQQRLDQLRRGAVEETKTALDFVRLLPLRAYAHMLRRNLHGELASFTFAFTGQFLPGVNRLAGADIVNAFHAPTVQPSPGSGLIMSIRNGRLNIAHVYQDGVMTEAERAILLDHLMQDLVGRSPL